MSQPISVQVRELRILRQMTQVQLSEKAGLARTAITKLENEDAMPSLAGLEKIATALQCELEINFRIR